ncbi:MarR family winged helix-turn-helix transcriptional regulator [Mycolicibacterium mengxianglii]|uniref:MarR family winged helix-turn-helix transcriptional regulator n=1 Tax=Mycolicibacterium mengxianglii TaxID=2736649 RepID=UPI0018D00332|nr:MarR family transcriptional regulator [Mycolicibacterium mengxianglii]
MGTASQVALQADALVRRLRSRLEALLAVQGCALDEWRVLDHVATNGPSVMSKIGKDVGLAPSVLSKLVDRMVTNNLLYRRIDPADRRRINIHLTNRGTAVHRSCADVLDRADAHLDTGVRDALTSLQVAVGNALDVLESAESVSDDNLFWTINYAVQSVAGNTNET